MQGRAERAERQVTELERGASNAALRADLERAERRAAEAEGRAKLAELRVDMSGQRQQRENFDFRSLDASAPPTGATFTLPSPSRVSTPKAVQRPSARQHLGQHLHTE